MTSPDRNHQRLTELFALAAELDPAAQAAFLEGLAPEDRELREELASLLAEDQADDEWLTPANEPVAAQLVGGARQKGDRIGNYEVEGLIGSGGAGDVYLAHQQRPQRLVAIKVMRHGLIDPARVRKFDFEAQLLARLQHPGIAQVFEANVFEDRGQRKPYFVMEFVEEAATLTAYAERAELSLQSRVQLFVGVCDAVAHGHHHGIVHCDLKPENLLVDAGGIAKVIDFGIARATDNDPNVTTLQTGHYELAGTLPYMSPEQAAGARLGLDARSDVYSLGCILYELLAGKVPLDFAGVPVPHAIHRILTETPRPLGRVKSHLRGDLEVIVGKCLAKERERRYRDADELAADLRRYLANEPIQARRPTALYQLRMFTRRHRGFVTGVALALLAILIGSVVAIQQAVEATRGAQRSRWLAYRASLAAAGAAVANHDMDQARANLAEAPKEYRDWEWRHLDSLLDASVRDFEPQGQGPLGLPFFETVAGHRVVGVWRDGFVHRYDLDGDALLDRQPANAIARDSETGTTAVLIGEQLRVTQGSTELVERSIEQLGFAQASALDNLAVAAGGRYVLVTSRLLAVRIDTTDNTFTSTVVDRAGIGVREVAVSRRGDVVLAAGIAGRPALWRNGSSEPVQLTDTFGAARSVAFDSAGDRIAMGLQDTTVGVWEVRSRERVIRGDGHRHAVTGVAFSNDGNRIYSGSLDRTVRIWRTASMAPLAVRSGHTRGVRGLAADPLGTWVASSGEDGHLRVWDAMHAHDHTTVGRHRGLVFPTAISHDGSLIASAGNDRTLRIWSTLQRQLLAMIPLPIGAPVDVAFDREGRRVVVASRSSLMVWDLEHGERMRRENMMPMMLGSMQFLSFSADGESVLIPQDLEGGVQSWDCESGEQRVVPRSELVASGSACVSSDGRFCVLTDRGAVTGMSDRADSDSGSALVVLAVDTGKRLEHPPISGAFAWLNGTTMLAARSAEDTSTLLLFNAATGTVEAHIAGHSDRIYDIASSPEGRRIVTSGRDGLRLWACDTGMRSVDRLGQRIVDLQGHTSFVWSASWSRDGEQIVTGGGDGSVRLWTLRTARQSFALRQEFGGGLAEQLAQLRQRVGGDATTLATWLRTDGGELSSVRRQLLRQQLLQEHEWR